MPLGCGCFTAAAWETELGPSSRQSTEALRSLSFLFAACAVRTWNLVKLFPSRSLCVGVACGVQHWIFREILQLLVGAILGSTVDTCSASVLGVWTNCTHFLRCGRLES